jgi:hypothetical protein
VIPYAILLETGCYWLFPKIGYGKIDAVDYLG